MIQTLNQDARVVHRLIEHIRSERLSVGDRLPPIRRLAQILAVSPSAVRDALMQAQTMGLVCIRPRSGAFVQSVNYAPLVDVLTQTVDACLVQVDDNLFHLLEARELLEVKVVEQAARRRRLEQLLPVRDALEDMQRTSRNETRNEFVEVDVRFHLEIARIGQNPVLITLLQSILNLLRPHLVQLPWTPERRETTDRSHAAIYQALVDGNAEQAREEMKQHLGMAYRSLLQRLEHPPEQSTGQRNKTERNKTGGNESEPTGVSQRTE